MISSRNRLVIALPALILFTSACGEDTPTTPTDTTTTTDAATVTATASPNPVTVIASTDPAYTFAATFVATVVTTNPSPITVRAIGADLQQSSGGIVITPAAGTDEAFRFDVRAPGNRIDVNGNMAIPFTFFYTLPNGGREAVITLSFTVATDAGAAGTITATVNLQ
jgi:ABC-type Fe3+-hydroxamate transport system substrate-binding protein